MKHKEKECTWAPGMQDTDVTFAGDHTWATILRAREDRSGSAGVSGRARLVMTGLGIVILGAGVWFFT